MLEPAGSKSFEYTLHEGAEAATVQWLFADEATLPVAVNLWELPPDGTEGMHSHDNRDPLEELYVVVQGEAMMRVDDEEYELGPGDAVLAPVGSKHDLRNTGATPLKVLVVWGRPGKTDWSGYRMMQERWVQLG